MSPQPRRPQPVALESLEPRLLLDGDPAALLADPQAAAQAIEAPNWIKAIGSSGSVQAGRTASDAAGNYYLAGSFQGQVDLSGGTNPGMGLLTATGPADAFVAKFDSQGTLQWASAYSSAGQAFGKDVAVDNAGNVYVAGSVDQAGAVLPNNGAMVWKLDAAGQTLWTHVADGAAEDVATGIQTDGARVYVSGLFSGAVDFDPSAATEVLNAQGDSDAFVWVLNTDGALVWVRSAGSAGVDAANDLALASDGSVVAVGQYTGTADFDPSAGVDSRTSAGLSDAFVWKLAPDGSHLWVASAGAAGSDIARAVALDAANNIHVAGQFSGTVDFDPSAATADVSSSAFDDGFVWKLDSAGALDWAVALGGASNDSARDIVVDSQGRVTTTGRYFFQADFDPSAGAALGDAGATADMYAWQLDATGALNWYRTLGGTGSAGGVSLALGAGDNLALVGEFTGNVSAPGLGAIEAGTGGIALWQLASDGTGNYLGGIWASGADAALAVRSTGERVYVAGKHSGPTSFDGTILSTGIHVQGYLAAYTAEGVLLWARGLEGDNSEITTLEVDAEGNIIAGGSFYGAVDFDPTAGISNLTSAGSADAFVWKLDSDGQLIWARRAGSTGFDAATALAVGEDSSILVGGGFNGTVDFDPSAGVVVMSM